MADTVLLGDSAPLLDQIKMHQELSAHISLTVYGHQPHKDAFVESTRVSEFPDFGYTYEAWWNSYSSHLEANAHAHQGLAGVLKENIKGFQAIDDLVSTTS